MILKNSLLMSALVLTVAGCSDFQSPESNHETFCKELKFRINNYSSVIVNHDNIANQDNEQFGQWQQNADMDRMRQVYREKCE